MTPMRDPATVNVHDLARRWWEYEQLELGDRVTGYTVLVDLIPESCGIDPKMRAVVGR
jgi:hypothetical protein